MKELETTKTTVQAKAWILEKVLDFWISLHPEFFSTTQYVLNYNHILHDMQGTNVHQIHCVLLDMGKGGFISSSCEDHFQLIFDVIALEFNADGKT